MTAERGLRPSIHMSHWTADQGAEARETNVAPAVVEAAVVEAAVRSLNGHDIDGLYVYPQVDQPELWMAIGGGKGNHYLAFISEDNARFTQALARTAMKGEVELVVGGQPGNYPRKHLIGLEEAIEAATDFFSTGRPSPELTWEQT